MAVILIFVPMKKNAIVKISAVSVVSYLLLYLTIVFNGEYSSMFTLWYGMFFTALDQVEHWFIRVCFIVLWALILFLIYILSKSELILNIILVITILLSIPFFSLVGL